MNWYYVLNNAQQGPVEESELRRLVQQGTITPATLVWRDGMANWEPYSAVVSPSVAAPPVVAAPVGQGPGGVVCSNCHGLFSADQVIRLGDGFVCAACKPIVTQRLLEGVADSGVEQVRKDHISHEASVRSVGLLYFLSAAGMILVGAIASVSAAEGGGRRAGLAAGVVGVFLLAFAAALIWVGLGLRRLRPWSRIPSGILAGIGLLGFPVGTLINAYILYLLFSKKGATVFSEDYQSVIAQTPHIKYRTSILVWVLLGLLLLLLGGGLVAALIGVRSR